MIHLTAIEYIAVLAAVTFGAAVQGLVGFGANLVAVPVLALVEPNALPATLSVWALPLNISMAVRERHGVDWHGAMAIVLWRVPGTVAGALTVAVAVLVGVVASARSATVPINRWTTAIAALASGAMGTATSVGGPPLALLYQNSEGVGHSVDACRGLHGRPRGLPRRPRRSRRGCWLARTSRARTTPWRGRRSSSAAWLPSNAMVCGCATQCSFLQRAQRCLPSDAGWADLRRHRRGFSLRAVQVELQRGDSDHAAHPAPAESRRRNDPGA